MNIFKRLLTKNMTKVPLFWVDFNYNKYKKNGNKNSCDAHIHPNFSGDEYIYKTINDLIDYIRDNYEVKKL